MDEFERNAAFELAEQTKCEIEIDAIRDWFDFIDVVALIWRSMIDAAKGETE